MSTPSAHDSPPSDSYTQAPSSTPGTDREETAGQTESLGTGTGLVDTHGPESTAQSDPAFAPSTEPDSDTGSIGYDTVASRLDADLPDPIVCSPPAEFSLNVDAPRVPIDPPPALQRVDTISTETLPSASARVRLENPQTREATLAYLLGAWLHSLSLSGPNASAHLATFLQTPASLQASSIRNGILIAIQEPGAVRLRSYDAWQAHRREVTQGEQAIWTWWTTRAPRCPDCGRGPKSHSRHDDHCNRSPADESWGTGPVDHSPTPRFDYAQTDQTPLDKAYQRPTSTEPYTAADVADRLSSLGGDAVDVHSVRGSEYPGPDSTAAYNAGWSPYSGNSQVYINTDAPTEQRIRETIRTVAQATAVPAATAPSREEFPGRYAEADAVTYALRYLLNIPGPEIDPQAIVDAWTPSPPHRILERLQRVQTLTTSMRSTLQIPLP